MKIVGCTNLLSRHLGRAFLLFLLSSHGLLAQTAYKTEHLSVRDGLSYRWVLDMLQDRQGQLWFATYDGLNRYDGHRFEVFRHEANNPASLQNNRIQRIVEDRQGLIWIQTETGIDCFDPANGRFEHIHSVNTAAGQPLRTIIGNEQNKRIWGVFYASQESGRLVMQEIMDRQITGLPMEIPASRIHNIQEYSADTLLIYADSGYWLASARTGRVVAAGVGRRFLRDWVPVDAGGKIWYFDTATRQLTGIVGPQGVGHTRYHRFFDAGPNEKWLVDEKGGIWRLDEAGRTFELISSRNIGDSKVYRDKDGIIWSCTQQGIIKITAFARQFEHRLSLPFQVGETPPIGFSARSMAELPGARVFAVHDGVALEANAGRSYHFGQGDIPEYVFQMIAGKDGALWFSSHQPGVHRFDPASRSITRFPLPGAHDIWVVPWLFQDRAGRFWLVYAEGAYLFDPSTRQFSPSQSGLDSLACASYDKATNTIVGVAKDQVFVLDCQTDQLTRVAHLFTSLPSQTPEYKGIVRHRGSIWVATTKGLYAIREADGQVSHFTQKDGLPQDIVYSIVPDGDYLWLGTHDGLCCFTIKDGQTRNFYIEDGLSHDEFNSRSTLLARDGRIWMGGLNGVNIFDPRQLRDAPGARAPHLFWSACLFTRRDTQLTLPFDALRTSEGLVLQPEDRNVALHFALNTYANPAQHRFSWYFEGLDQNWGGWSNLSTLHFQTLPPGSYTLHVRAGDEKGTLADNELHIPITVLQVWYLRWWALLLYGLAAGFVLYLFFKFQLTRKLEQVENQRLKSLDEWKNRLYANITHEFRTPLTLLLGPTETALRRWSELPSETLRNTLLTVQRNGYRLLHLVNQILDLRKMEEGRLDVFWVRGDMILFLQYITDSFHSLAEQQQVYLAFESEVAEGFEMDYDKDKTLKIISNLLHNAIKFTPPGGKVTLRARVEADTLRIAVEDTGSGMEAGQLERIFERFYQADTLQRQQGEGTGIGLALTKELVVLLGGRIAVESRPGRGSIFTVELPVHLTASSIDEQPGMVLHQSYQTEGDLAPLSPLHTAPDDAPLVLVVDDNPEVARYVGACLARHYRIEYAENGELGIEKALQHIPDLVVSDLMMPGKDGFELTQTLKNDERSSHIPVILLTARIEVEARLEGLRRGADAYLSKPFQEEELLILAEQQMLLRQRMRQRYAALALPERDSGVQNIPAVESADLWLEDTFMQKVLETIETQYSDPAFGSEALARSLFISQSQLNRKLNALTGKSSIEVLRELRLRRAITLLGDGNRTIAEVAWEAGFNDPSYFARIFVRAYGMTPSEWREKNLRSMS